MKPSLVCLLCLVMASSTSIGGSTQQTEFNDSPAAMERPAAQKAAQSLKPKAVTTVLSVGRSFGVNLQLML